MSTPRMKVQKILKREMIISPPPGHQVKAVLVTIGEESPRERGLARLSANSSIC